MNFVKNFLKQALRKQLLIRSLYLYPSYVQIEPTAKCNLKCKFCIRARSNSTNEADMKFDLFKSIVDQLRQPLYATEALNLTGLGEPFMNPNLVQMVNYAKNKGLKVSMVTNLTLVSEEKLKGLIEAGLDLLSISVDGATKETFESIRVGAVFEEVIENIKFLVKLKKIMHSKKPRIFLNSTIGEQNVNELPKIIRLAEELGVDGVCFMKQAISGKSYFDGQPLNVSLKNELSKNKIKVNFHLTAMSACAVPRSCYITFDGKVLPCYPLYELVPRSEYSYHQFGDLNVQSLREIWFSSSYKKFRAKNVSGKRSFICESCPFGKVEFN